MRIQFGRRILSKLAVIVLIGATSVTAQKIRDGFRGFEWGADISQFPIDLFREDWRVNLAEPIDEIVSIRTTIDSLGGVAFEYLDFEFFEGKFYAVHGEEDLHYGQKLKPVLVSLYGEPTSFGMRYTRETHFWGYPKWYMSTDSVTYMMFEWDEKDTYRRYRTDFVYRKTFIFGDQRTGARFEMYSKLIYERAMEYEKTEDQREIREASEKKRIDDSLKLEKAKDEF